VAAKEKTAPSSGWAAENSEACSYARVINAATLGIRADEEGKSSLDKGGSMANGRADLSYATDSSLSLAMGSLEEKFECGSWVSFSL
jgi:hypothetical protein